MEFSSEQIREAWDELRVLASAARRRYNQAGGIYTTSDVLVSAMGRMRNRIEKGQAVSWENQREFFAAAAQEMQQAVVDHIRREMSAKRGGNQVESGQHRRKRLPLDDVMVMVAEDPPQVLAVNKCIDRLAGLNEDLAEVVRLRVFAGLTNKQIGDLMDVSSSTIQNRWDKAKRYLEKCLGDAYGG